MDTDFRRYIFIKEKNAGLHRSVAMPNPSQMIDLPQVTITRTVDVDENKERGNWSSGMEFLLSCLSYAVGLGNIWRFPYLCYRNGGGAFLIPYTLMLIFVGMPLFLLELSFGQYASEGPITIWKASPLFQGIGYAMFLMSGLVGVYYNMVLAWALFYLCSSFTTHLPWSSCDNWWNTNACRKFDSKNCTAHDGVMLYNGTCMYKSEVDEDVWLSLQNSTDNTKMASDEYFHNYVLDLTDGLHDLGGLRWQLVLCLMACWIIVFFCLLKGVKSMGKVVYFTALFPYVVLVILLIRGATLDGAYDGIMFYLTPDWERLKEARVWGDAAMQIFFSLSPCWGGLITLASYNRFHNNCFKDMIFISVGNCGTSFFAGFVIFSIIGFMAHELGVPVSKVASEGAGLAFVAYPEAVARLPVSPLWAILFFFMLMTLGLGTQFTLIETVVTTLVDTWPEKLRHRKAFVLLGVCVFMFFGGMTICSNGGMYVLQLMDNYCASFSALIIGLFEVVVISWIYGVDRFMEDIKVMLGHYPLHRLYWKILWKYLVPIFILFILIFSWIDLKPTQYGDYVYPTWATALGWMFSLFSVSAIPIVAVYKIYHCEGPIWQRIVKLSKPTEHWGPRLQQHRIETHSPKHTDSQVPLALPNDDMDGDIDYPDDYPKFPGGGYVNGGNFYRAVNGSGSFTGNDDTASESEMGLQLTVPPSSVRETGL